MVTTQSPIVSVLMSVYNGEKFVAEALAGIRNQTFSDFEFIIIDDASTDRTPELLAEAAALDPRIRVLTNAENLMLVRSLNRGLAVARGRYIARQDADDISLPHRLELQVRFLEQNPGMTAVSGRFHCIENGWLHPRENLSLHLGPSAMLPWHLTLGYCVQHSISMFRHGILSNYLESRLHAEDYDFWARLLRHGGISVLPEVIAHVRLHESNITRTREEEVGKSSRLAQRDLYQWLTGYHLSDWEVADLRAFGNGHFSDIHDPEALDETLLRLKRACAESIPGSRAYINRQLCRHYLHWLAISLVNHDVQLIASLIRRSTRWGTRAGVGGLLDLVVLQLLPRAASLMARRRVEATPAPSISP